MSDKMKPTKKQQRILEFIGQFKEENKISPTYREIMAGLGYRSVATVAEHIDNMVAKSLLNKSDFQARTVEAAGSVKMEVDFEMEIEKQTSLGNEDAAKILREAWKILKNRV
jgi:SOS-response transcriptional repressor LexA